MPKVKNNDNLGFINDCMKAVNLAETLLLSIGDEKYKGRVAALATSMLTYSIHQATLKEPTDEKIIEAVNAEISVIKHFLKIQEGK